MNTYIGTLSWPDPGLRAAELALAVLLAFCALVLRANSWPTFPTLPNLPTLPTRATPSKPGNPRKLGNPPKPGRHR